MAMSYGEWEMQVPDAIKADSLWKVVAYRKALYLGDLSWSDAAKMMQDPRTLPLSGQLYRAAGSVGANIAEGYSRGTGRDRARFYEYSLGSARETRDWYFKARHVVGADLVSQRMEMLSEIIRLLLTMIPDQRGSMIREESVEYLAR
jgi:four helix bundle protein